MAGQQRSVSNQYTILTNKSCATQLTARLRRLSDTHHKLSRQFACLPAGNYRISILEEK